MGNLLFVSFSWLTESLFKGCHYEIPAAERISSSAKWKQWANEHEAVQTDVQCGSERQRVTSHPSTFLILISNMC